MGTRYHHGDLANALVAAGLELARAGGPETVRLRAVASEVGVSATAAYRHFAGLDGLARAVRDAARDRLAEAMAQSAAEAPPDRELHALASGYVRFARTEPGMFRTAHCQVDNDCLPFRMLVTAARRRSRAGTGTGAVAALAMWATVHGLATVVVDRQVVDVSHVDGVLDVAVGYPLRASGASSRVPIQHGTLEVASTRAAPTGAARGGIDGPGAA